MNLNVVVAHHYARMSLASHHFTDKTSSRTLNNLNYLKKEKKTKLNLKFDKKKDF